MKTEDPNKHSAEWFARLNSEEASDDDHWQHREWLAQDEANREAFDRLEQTWEALDDLTPWAGEELRRLEQKFVPPKVKPSRKIAEPRWGGGSWLGWFGWSGAALAAVAALAVFVVMPALHGVDSYHTLEGEQRKIVLDDGSRAHLNSASALRVDYSKDERQITLLKGEALFDVVKDPSRPFVVNARENKVVAVGTTFSVYYNNGDIDITVVEGQVAVLPVATSSRDFIQQVETQPADNDTARRQPNNRQAGVLIKSDHQIRVNERGEVGEPKVVDATKVTSWERGMLVLDGMPLRQVAKEISRYVHGDVQVASNVPDYPVTGVIKIRDQDTMLQLLSQVVPVTAVRQSATVTLLYAAEGTEETH